MKSNALHITRDSIRIFVPQGAMPTSPRGKCAGVRAGRIILPTAGRRGQHSAEAPATKEPPMGGSQLVEKVHPDFFDKLRNTIRQDGVSFWNAAGRAELAASTGAHQRTDCCRISRRAACPQTAVYRRCLRLPRGGVRAPRPMHERGEPFRRGRRPRRPVSAAVPRWERIPTSLRAAKQVPLGYRLAWQSVSKPHNSCTFPQISS